MKTILSHRPHTLKGQIILLCATFSAAIILMQAVFVLSFIKTATKNYEILLKSTVEQLSENMNSLAGRLQDVGNLLTFNNSTQQIFRPEALSTKMQILRTTEITIDTIKSSNTSIDAIILTDFKQLYLGDASNDNFWILNRVRDLLVNKKLNTANLRNLHFIDPSDGSMRFVYIIPSNSENGNQPQFYTLIIHNLNSLRKAAEGLGDAAGTYILYYGMSRDSYLLRSWPHGEKLDAGFNPESFNSGFSRVGGNIIYTQLVDMYGLTIIGMVPTSELRRALVSIQLPNTIMVVFFIIFIIVEGWVLIHNITAPISYMVGFIDSLSASDANEKRIQFRHKNEIGLLANDINNLLDKIKIMTNNVARTNQQLYQAKLARQQAELAAFQSQVNPHFLYNTLDCVRSMAIGQDIPEIGMIAAAMVKIFRYSIKEGDIVLLSDELACIEQYLTIMKIRHPDRFSFFFEVDDAIRSALVPKMVLQPLVENAMLHGLEQKRGKGGLHIRGRLEKDASVVLEVEDNGKGMSPGSLENLRSTIAAPLEEEWTDASHSATKSIGLINIEKRIRLTYGAGYGISVFPGVEGGLRVSFRIPYRKAESG